MRELSINEVDEVAGGYQVYAAAFLISLGAAYAKDLIDAAINSLSGSGSSTGSTSGSTVGGSCPSMCHGV